MKSSIVLFVLAFILVTVQAAIIRGTNADRMARGLPPRAPAKLYTPTRVSGTIFFAGYTRFTYA